jgi:hypothetical protein
MTLIKRLPRLDQRKRQACPKPMPTVVRKQERIKAKAANEADFRKSVWVRDQGKSRASGKPLGKSGSNWEKVGEVHHVLARSTNPDKIYDVSNGLLLSKQEHALAETMCPGEPSKSLLNIEGPTDRGKPQTFVWLDVNGKELKRRIG